MYESLEHLLDASRYFNSKRYFFTTTALLEQSARRWPLFGESHVISLLLEEARNNPTRQSRILAREYRSLSNDYKCYLPYFMTNPSYYDESQQLSEDCFDYQRVNRYSTNSGSAIGVNLSEALLHGLNEVVERDAWSVFLIRHFFSCHPDLPVVLDRETLPADLNRIITMAESEINSRVVIFDLTVDIKIPTFCAVIDTLSICGEANKGDAPICYGFGSSIIAEHALQRAVSELVQACMINGNSPDAANDYYNTLLPVKDYPPLYRCVEFNINKLLSRGHKLIKFAEVAAIADVRLDNPNHSDKPATTKNNNIDKLLKLSLEKVADAGFEACYSISHVADSGIIVANVQIPGLETFFLIASGNIVLPSQRGLSFLPSSS